MKIFKILILASLLASSCASKKQILYIQDSDEAEDINVEFAQPTIQPNDILSIKVETLVPEAAIPYNRISNNASVANTVEILKIDGYLVKNDKTIKFPVLGEIAVGGLTVNETEEEIRRKLIDGGHLVDPSVYVRILNAKVTILGEVNAPGTYSFTEQNINVLQALGYAKDLTINGKREDIMIIREKDGVRKISHLDLTSKNLLSHPNYSIQPNDVIIVNQNNPRVKNAGFIGDIGTVLTIASLALSVTILLTR